MRLDPGTALAVHDNGALTVDHPYFSSQILGKGPYLGGDLLGIQPFPLVHGGLQEDDDIGFIVMASIPGISTR